MPAEVPPPPSICEQVSQWFQRQIKTLDSNNAKPFVHKCTTGAIDPTPPEQLVVPTDNLAEQILRNFHRESRKFGKKYPELDVLWSKAEENARKVALILAAGGNYDTPCVTPRDADYACRLVRFLLLDFDREIIPSIASSKIESQKKRLLGLIAKYGIKGREKAFLTKSSGWVNQKERNNLLADLIEAEQIVCAINDNKTFYWTTENFRKYLANVK